jgi:hypothetical protein
VEGGQPEPLDFLSFPRELSLFAFCTILKCFGECTVKPYDRNAGNRKNSGNRAVLLKVFQAEHNQKPNI